MLDQRDGRGDPWRDHLGDIPDLGLVDEMTVGVCCSTGGGSGFDAVLAGDPQTQRRFLHRLFDQAVRGAPRRATRSPSSPQETEERAITPTGRPGTDGRQGAASSPTPTECQRLQGRSLWEENGLVFPNHVGRPLSSQNLPQRHFHPLLERHHLPKDPPRPFARHPGDA
jgi:hypothetical protein